MSAWTRFFRSGPTLTTIFFAIATVILQQQLALAAPLTESSTELEYYPVADATGCYYNFQHYDEGDRILTNEPCLNCTCHNRMLMCYLRVCPFTKAIGQDCKVEKRPDQCCPVITCPEVPVQLLTSSTTESSKSTEVGHLDAYGCSIDGLFYTDGARVPSEPNKPCELCYCIRNKTACVMQECTLNIEGCRPVYQPGVCCPVKYDCDHPEDKLLETTVRPTPALVFTTTLSPNAPVDCIYNNEVYGDGALIKKDKPCEHCYCMKGDIVCAVQECAPTPLEKINCTALPPKEGQCCPDTYECENMTDEELTTGSYDYTTLEPIRVTDDDHKFADRVAESEEQQEPTTMKVPEFSPLPARGETAGEIPSHIKPEPSKPTEEVGSVEVTEPSQEHPITEHQEISSETEPAVPHGPGITQPVTPFTKPSTTSEIAPEPAVSNEIAPEQEVAITEGAAAQTESIPSMDHVTELPQEPLPASSPTEGKPEEHIPDTTLQPEVKPTSSVSQQPEEIAHDSFEPEEGQQQITELPEEYQEQVTVHPDEQQQITELPEGQITEHPEGEQQITEHPDVETTPRAKPEESDQDRHAPSATEKAETELPQVSVTESALPAETEQDEKHHVEGHFAEEPQTTALPIEAETPGKHPEVEGQPESQQPEQEKETEKPEVPHADEKPEVESERPEGEHEKTEKPEIGTTERVEPESETAQPEKEAPHADEKPEIDNEIPEVESEKPEPESEKPEVESEKPESESAKPESDEHEEAESERPVSEGEKVESESEKPESESEKPESESEKPESETDKPEHETEEGVSEPPRQHPEEQHPQAVPTEETAEHEDQTERQKERPEEMTTVHPELEGQQPEQEPTEHHDEEEALSHLPEGEQPQQEPIDLPEEPEEHPEIEPTTEYSEHVTPSKPQQPEGQHPEEEPVSVHPLEPEHDHGVDQQPEQEPTDQQTGEEDNIPPLEQTPAPEEPEIEHITEGAPPTVKPIESLEHVTEAVAQTAQPVERIEPITGKLPKGEESATSPQPIGEASTEPVKTEDRVAITETPKVEEEQPQSTTEGERQPEEAPSSTEKILPELEPVTGAGPEKAAEDHIAQIPPERTAPVETASESVPIATTEQEIPKETVKEVNEQQTEVPEPHKPSPSESEQQEPEEKVKVTTEPILPTVFSTGMPPRGVSEEETTVPEKEYEDKQTMVPEFDSVPTEAGVTESATVEAEIHTERHIPEKESPLQPTVSEEEQSSAVPPGEKPGYEYPTPEKPGLEEPEYTPEATTQYPVYEPTFVSSSVSPLCGADGKCEVPVEQVTLKVDVVSPGEVEKHTVRPEIVETTTLPETEEVASIQPVSPPKESDDVGHEESEVPEKETEPEIEAGTTPQPAIQEHSTESKLVTVEDRIITTEPPVEENEIVPTEPAPYLPVEHIPVEGDVPSSSLRPIETTLKEELPEHDENNIIPEESEPEKPQIHEHPTEAAPEATTLEEKEPDNEILPEKEYTPTEVSEHRPETERPLKEDKPEIISQDESAGIHPGQQAVGEESEASTPVVEIEGAAQTTVKSQETEEPVTEAKKIEVPTEVPVEAEHTTVAHGEISQDSAEQVPEEEEPYERLIPGEGNCLVDGQTYANMTKVPPINHCQISCICISSILQCESVTCLPAPSNLQNCMPVFPGPDSCCPTYSCSPPGPTHIKSDSHKMEQPQQLPASSSEPAVEVTTEYQQTSVGGGVSQEPTTVGGVQETKQPEEVTEVEVAATTVPSVKTEEMGEDKLFPEKETERPAEISPVTVVEHEEATEVSAGEHKVPVTTEQQEPEQPTQSPKETSTEGLPEEVKHDEIQPDVVVPVEIQPPTEVPEISSQETEQPTENEIEPIKHDDSELPSSITEEPVQIVTSRAETTMKPVESESHVTEKHDIPVVVAEPTQAPPQVSVNVPVVVVTQPETSSKKPDVEVPQTEQPKVSEEPQQPLHPEQPEQPAQPQTTEASRIAEHTTLFEEQPSPKPSESGETVPQVTTSEVQQPEVVGTTESSIKQQPEVEVEQSTPQFEERLPEGTTPQVEIEKSTESHPEKQPSEEPEPEITTVSGLPQEAAETSKPVEIETTPQPESGESATVRGKPEEEVGLQTSPPIQPTMQPEPSQPVEGVKGGEPEVFTSPTLTQEAEMSTKKPSEEVPQVEDKQTTVSEVAETTQPSVVMGEEEATSQAIEGEKSKPVEETQTVKTPQQQEQEEHSTAHPSKPVEETQTVKTPQQQEQEEHSTAHPVEGTTLPEAPQQGEETTSQTPPEVSANSSVVPTLETGSSTSTPPEIIKESSEEPTQTGLPESSSESEEEASVKPEPEVETGRPEIPGEGAHPEEEPTSTEESEEEVKSSEKPLVVTPIYDDKFNLTTLFTSGPYSGDFTSKSPSVLGELSTSAVGSTTSITTPSTMKATSEMASTALPPSHELPESSDYGSQQVEDEDYDETEPSFGPGTCRYGGKVYVSAQQIPRDDPCDFCFCFRSDIICLQQSCPPPIPRCHEEPIRGFCCPRYECPVSMSTSVNISSTTTTTTTTVPPHFLSHAYKGKAIRRGCQINGQSYQVGEAVRSASGPCLHCTCGGDGKMKCDPKACSPEPMLRQMIAAAVSRRRR